MKSSCCLSVRTPYHIEAVAQLLDNDSVDTFLRQRIYTQQ
jgi:hypothetical protein